VSEAGTSRKGRTLSPFFGARTRGRRRSRLRESQRRLQNGSKGCGTRGGKGLSWDRPRGWMQIQLREAGQSQVRDAGRIKVSWDDWADPEGLDGSS
jgi:hypothetical protein